MQIEIFRNVAGGLLRTDYMRALYWNCRRMENLLHLLLLLGSTQEISYTCSDQVITFETKNLFVNRKTNENYKLKGLLNLSTSDCQREN